MVDSPAAGVELSVAGGVATLTLTSPGRRNALSPAMGTELFDALGRLAVDDEVLVVVLTGKGEDFCAGADLKKVGELSTGKRPAEFDELLHRLATFEKPTIARVRGFALGAGLGLIAGCHFAVAAKSATFGAPEVKRGLFPMMIVALLDRLIARRDLLRLALLGNHLPATEAERIGLVSEVVADELLDSRVDALAKELGGQSPEAMRRGLRAIHRQSEMSFEQALPYLRDELVALLASDDAREGLRAFAEKRPPRWRGR